MNSKNIFPRSLQYLIAVAEYGSFTHAAEALYVSQPALSQQIKKLEDSLQSILLDRSGKTIRLTNSGKVYVRYAHRAWKDLDAGMLAIHDVKNLNSGSLHLGLAPIADHLVCCLLENFHTSYPNVFLNPLEMVQSKIETAVVDGDIDIGIVFSDALTNSAHSSELEILRLFEEDLYFVVGNKNAYANKKTINLKGFAQQSLALFNNSFMLRQLIDNYCNRYNIQPNISVETNSLRMIIEMVQMGPLSTVLPGSIINTQCGLHTIAFSPKLSRRAVSIIHRKEGYKSFACSAFIKLANRWSSGEHKKIPRIKLTPCIND